MGSDGFSFKSLEGAWVCLKILGYELFEIALTDETDAGAIFFLGSGKAYFSSNFADLFFVKMADREKDLGKGILFHCMKKVGLIFTRI